MSQQNDRYYEIAHIEARLAGGEGADHPRQRLCAFLEREGHRDRVARANEFYEFRGAKRSPGEGFLREVLDFAFFDPHSAYRKDPAFQELVDRAVEYALELVRLSRRDKHFAALQRAVAALDAQHVVSTYERLEWSDDRLDAFKYTVGRPGPGG